MEYPHLGMLMFLNWRFRRTRSIFIVLSRIDLLFETRRFSRHVGRFHVRKFTRFVEHRFFARNVIAVPKQFSNSVFFFIVMSPTHVSGHLLFASLREQLSSRGRDRTRTRCFLPTNQDCWTAPAV